MSLMLSVKGVKKNFGNLEVLKDISIDVNKGEVISILGPSGSGKTTLLRCINFLEVADEGKMVFDGVEYDMHSATKQEILDLRKHTGFVFQSYNLFLNKTAIQNVTEGLIIGRKMHKDKAVEIGLEALDRVGMLDRKDFYPHQLSGGQQQRVAIARALATNPKIIYFDEPTSALDPELTGEVLQVIKKLSDDGMTMVIVTHEINFARTVSTDVILMEDGYVVERNKAQEFFDDPKEQRTREFLQMITNTLGEDE